MMSLLFFRSRLHRPSFKGSGDEGDPERNLCHTSCLYGGVQGIILYPLPFFQGQKPLFHIKPAPETS